MVYTLFPDSLNMSTVEECVARFEKGDVAIIPTDSVYAIAGDFQHPKALEKLAKIKGESVPALSLRMFPGRTCVSPPACCP